MMLKTVLEALIFGSPKPMLTKELMAALKAAAEASEDEPVRALGKINEEAVADTLTEMQVTWGEGERGFRLVEQVNGWSFVTDAGAAPWVRQLYPEAKPTRLSGPALETLAIIAYRQPVTRADVEAVRGVAVDGVMQVLLERSLVRITGRADVPGRPLLYGTTEYFLQHFGLKTTDDLPNSAELKRVALPTPPPPPEAAPAPAEPAPAAANTTPEEAPAATPEGQMASSPEAPVDPEPGIDPTAPLPVPEPAPEIVEEPQPESPAPEDESASTPAAS